jgi:TetR/AcrR family transcriptional regulator, lmrAB and yxaGH operons repressor
MSKQSYIPLLLDLFRQYGYDGVTLSKISQATGLGKASLYHHFPGGKDEMVETVLAAREQGLEQIVLEVQQSEGDALARLRQMCDRISAAYENGEKPCILAALMLDSAKDVFRGRVQTLLQHWIDAIAAILVEAGLDPSIAQERGQDAIIAIQGALILSQGLKNPTPFQRVMQQLPQTLCRDLANQH